MLQPYKNRTQIRALVQRALSFLLFGLLLLVLTVTPLWAQTEGFTITWFTIAAGGGTSQGAGYTVRGAAGQAQVGAATNGSYQLTSGYLVIGEEGPQQTGQAIYLPLVRTTP